MRDRWGERERQTGKGRGGELSNQLQDDLSDRAVSDQEVNKFVKENGLIFSYPSM